MPDQKLQATIDALRAKEAQRSLPRKLLDPMYGTGMRGGLLSAGYEMLTDADEDSAAAREAWTQISMQPEAEQLRLLERAPTMVNQHAANAANARMRGMLPKQAGWFKDK